VVDSQAKGVKPQQLRPCVVFLVTDKQGEWHILLGNQTTAILVESTVSTPSRLLGHLVVKCETASKKQDGDIVYNNNSLIIDDYLSPWVYHRLTSAWVAPWGGMTRS